MKKWTALLALSLIFILAACTSEPDPNVPSDPSTETPTEPEASEPSEMEQLLASLTLEEKVGQMMQPERSGISLEEITVYNIGSILNAGGSHPNNDPLASLEDWHTMIDTFQNAALDSSSGIPMLYGIDAVHGNNNVYGATIFPHNINLGMIQDLSVVSEVGAATGVEMRALGMHLNFSPAVSVAEDIRWGRTYESMSQNVDIVSEGMRYYLEGIMPYAIPTVKHYVGDGGTYLGIDQGNSILDESTIRARHLPPYIDAIEMNVPFIMASYHSIRGIKLHGHDYWLNDVLKEELGFEGVLLSDYNAINQLEGDFKTQLTTAINAGVDMLMQPFNWKEAYYLILEAVEEGTISEARIDDAVLRILNVKEDYGLFDEPVPAFEPERIYQDSHQQIALDAATQSMVLLENDGVLPLENPTIYLSGPAADHVGLLAGGWTTFWQGNPNADIGVGTSIYDGLNAYGDLTDSYEDADTVILAFSEISYSEGAGDTMSPTLTGGLAHPENAEALALAETAQADGKTVIALLISGRPLVLGSAVDHFDAMVAMFLPGSEGGEAIAKLLYGDASFTGKLSFYWPNTIIDLDVESLEDNHRYPLGYGLETE